MLAFPIECSSNAYNLYQTITSRGYIQQCHYDVLMYLDMNRSHVYWRGQRSGAFEPYEASAPHIRCAELRSMYGPTTAAACHAVAEQKVT